MAKFINENGDIKEGILLTDEEVSILEDPLFNTTAVNLTVRGPYIGSSSITGFLTYILQHFELRRRVQPVQEAEIVEAEVFDEEEPEHDNYKVAQIVAHAVDVLA